MLQVPPPPVETDTDGLYTIAALRQITGGATEDPNSPQYVEDSHFSAIIEAARADLENGYSKALSSAILEGRPLVRGTGFGVSVEIDTNASTSRPGLAEGTIADEHAPYVEVCTLPSGARCSYDADIEVTAIEAPFPRRRFCLRGRTLLVLPGATSKVLALVAPEAKLKPHLMAEAIEGLNTRVVAAARQMVRDRALVGASLRGESVADTEGARTRRTS